eukprot:RCo003141
MERKENCNKTQKLILRRQYKKKDAAFALREVRRETATEREERKGCETALPRGSGEDDNLMMPSGKKRECKSGEGVEIWNALSSTTLAIGLRAHKGEVLGKDTEQDTSHLSAAGLFERKCEDG